MKKLFFFLLSAVLSISFGVAQTQPNIYASNLKAVETFAGTFEFTFTLNADAKSVTINVSNGDSFTVTNAAVNLDKGTRTVTGTLTNCVAATNYTWTVTAEGKSASPANPTRVSSTDVKYRFYTPAGLAVDNSFDSPAFGRIYVAEGSGSYYNAANPTTYWGSGRITYDGIYIFTPELDAVNTANAYYGDIAWNVGALNWTTSTGLSPGRLSIDAAGKVYIADNTVVNAGIYVMDPENPTASFKPIFDDGMPDANGLYDKHGRISAIHVEGSGSSTVLHYIDRNYLPAGYVARTYLPSGMIFKQDIGDLSAPISGEPTIIYDNANSYLANDAIGLVADGRGGFWVVQNRGTDAAAIPSLSHYTSAGVCDYRSKNGSNVDLGSSARGNVAMNEDKTLLAVSTNRGVRVYNVTYDSGTGVPTLVSKAFIDLNTSNIDGISFDVADNVYMTSASAEWFYVYSFPKAENKFTTPAPSSQPVTPTTTITLPSKTFNVTVPEGTEHVYIMGDFTLKNWDYTTPYELTATGNANEFEGTFPCVDGVAYYYLCGKEIDFKEGVAGATLNDPAEQATTPRSIASAASTTDVVAFWWHSPKITFNVSFDTGVTVPDKLSVNVWPDGGPTPTTVALTKSGNTYSGSISGMFETNTTYQYFIPTTVPTLEDQAPHRAEWPGRTDLITGFLSTPISGEYYIPATGAQAGWASLYEAFDDINLLGIDGDVTLLIADDLVETKNVGLLNPSAYSITIRPDADEDREIRFTQAADNAGPSGALLLGIDNGLAWTGMGVAQNIVIDGYAAGGSTRRLKIVTPSGGIAGQSPIVIMNDGNNIAIKNSIITAEGNRSYAVYLRSYVASGSYMPNNVLIENNVITNTISGSAQGIAAYSNGNPTAATGVVIKDNIITATTRGMFLSSLDGVDIINNEIHILQTVQGGTLSEGIYAYVYNKGNWNIKNNRFVEFKTMNQTSANGVKAIYSDGTSNDAAVFNIENNYFTGFTKTSSSGECNLQAIHINNGATAKIYHNTFYLNHPGGGLPNSSPSSGTASSYSAINLGTGATTIENNLFVSDYDATLNYFIRGDATADNNVFVINPANTKTNASSGTITGTNATIAEVFFVDDAAGNLDIGPASEGNGDLAVPYIPAIPNDIHGTVRNSPLTYAGAFEGEEFTTGLPTKTFTVTAPEGTEHVYVIGSFTVRDWNYEKPYELLPTGNPNEFSGIFAASDAVDTEYLYFCEKSAGDYIEAIGDGTVARSVNRIALAADTDATDEIPYWYRMNKIVLEVTFADGLSVPAQLSAYVADHNNTSFEIDLEKNGNTFTYVLGNHEGAKYGVKTSYNYYIPTSTPIVEDHALRYAAAPKVTDVISAYLSNGLAGEYFIPAAAGQRGWPALKDAFDDINLAGISGDVTLLIASDIVSPVNAGLINPTDHAITIRPDADEDRTITFNQEDFDNPGPQGSLILGIGSSLKWKDVAPARNITIDGFADGGSTRRLKIATAATHFAGNLPLLILDNSSNITVKNCIIEHVGKATGSSTYGIYLRTNPAFMIDGNGCTSRMPTNVTIENNEIINTTSGAAAQGIGIVADGTTGAWIPASGIIIKDNIIRARTRGIFVNDINGLEITGNEFHIVQTSGGLMSSAIFANNRVTGTFLVTGNKFVELKTANTNTGNYGIQAIITGDGTSVWYIDNNYFTGFDKTSATNVAMLQGIRVGNVAETYIRHNTFYLNELTNKPNYTSTGPSNATYSAINIAGITPVIRNNLFVSNEDACPNFFIRGDAPEATDNNVFGLQAGSSFAKIATGVIPADLKKVEKVEFEDAAAGVLDLVGESINDHELGVTPLEEVPADIYGTLRSTTLVYAGAFEGPEFFEKPEPPEPPEPPTDGIDDVNTGSVRIVQKGGQLEVSTDAGVLQGVKLYDMQGRVLSVRQSIAANTCSISVPDKGVYLVETVVDGVRKVHKIFFR